MLYAACHETEWRDHGHQRSRSRGSGGAGRLGELAGGHGSRAILVARILRDRVDQLVGARDGGRHPDRQPQVPRLQRPEALLGCLSAGSRLGRRSLLGLQSLLGRPPPGGDEQLGHAHAVVEGLTRPQPLQVYPPDRPLLTARERGPQHAPEGQLAPHSPQLLLGGLEQLQTHGGRQLRVPAAAGDRPDLVFRAQLVFCQAAAVQDVQDLGKVIPRRLEFGESESRVRDHLQGHAEPVASAVEPGVLLAVDRMQPQRGQVLLGWFALDAVELAELVPDDSGAPSAHRHVLQLRDLLVTRSQHVSRGLNANAELP